MLGTYALMLFSKLFSYVTFFREQTFQGRNYPKMPTTAFSYYRIVNSIGKKEEHLSMKKFEIAFFFKQGSWANTVINKQSSHYAKQNS